MLLRARSRALPLSLRYFHDGVVISAVHKHELYLSEAVEAGKEVYREIREQKEDGTRTLWELVAESPWEEALLRNGARFHRASEGGMVRFTWRIPVPAKTGNDQQ